MDPWSTELLLAAGAGDRRSLVRDADRGLLIRVHRGAYIAADAWRDAGPEQRHLLQIRALAATTATPPVFSHWSAAILHGLPVVDPRLQRLHVTFPTPAPRGNEGVAGHVFALTPEELVLRDGVVATNVARTVVDVAGSSVTGAGVATADGALRAGLARDQLLAAVDLAGPRKAARRIGTVAEFADGRAGSAGESVSRWSMHLLGVEPPVLQHPVRDVRGHAGDLDFWFPAARSGGEFDGVVKYLDPRYAPKGAAMKVYEEKLREDRVRAEITRLARWGWAEARNPHLLRPVLARVGVLTRRVVLV